MKRELIFDTTIPERPAPRVWDSARDIPKGVLVSNRRDRDKLYINSRGLGWWVGEKPDLRSIEIAEKDGWLLEEFHDTYAPFTEVFL